MTCLRFAIGSGLTAVLPLKKGETKEPTAVAEETVRSGALVNGFYYPFSDQKPGNSGLRKAVIVFSSPIIWKSLSIHLRLNRTSIRSKR